MARYIQSILAANQAISADGDVVYDLPTNPLSALLLHISPLAETSTITAHRLLEGFLSAVDSIRIDHEGGAVFNASGVDAAVLALLWQRFTIWQSNAVETNNDRRSIILPICFGRKAFDPLECFPETRRGEFTLTVTWDIADSGFDGLRITIESIELPDAQPNSVQKVSTLSQTFAATGQNQIDLHTGNILRALLMFGTTGFAGASPAPSLGNIELLADNRQVYVSNSDFENLRGVLGLKGIPFPPDFRHIHSVNAAGAGREDTLEPEIGASIDDNYVLLDLDPTMDDLYSLDTNGLGRLHLDIDAETADAVRVLQVEKVPASRYT